MIAAIFIFLSTILRRNNSVIPDDIQHRVLFLVFFSSFWSVFFFIYFKRRHFQKKQSYINQITRFLFALKHEKNMLRQYKKRKKDGLSQCVNLKCVFDHFTLLCCPLQLLSCEMFLFLMILLLFCSLRFITLFMCVCACALLLNNMQFRMSRFL